MKIFKVPDHWKIDLLPTRRGTNFRAKLFHLMFSADPDNLQRLRKGFPEEYAVFIAWYGSTGQDEGGHFPETVEIND